MIRKTTLLLLAAPLIAGCALDENETASVDQASSVHLKGGANAEPTFFDLGVVLEAKGALSGLGYGDVVVELLATAQVTSDCQNPGNGEHYPPGQEPAPITVSGSQTIPDSELKNGTTPFDVFTASPGSTIAGAPDCPNKSWTEHILDLSFKSATLTVKQGTPTVLSLYCTFDPWTTDGRVPAATVTCN